MLCIPARNRETEHSALSLARPQVLDAGCEAEIAVNTNRCIVGEVAYLSDMLSTPTAIPSSICWDLTEFAMFTTACRPDEHSRFTVLMGTSTGTPAAMAAARETYRGDGG